MQIQKIYGVYLFMKPFLIYLFFKNETTHFMKIFLLKVVVHRGSFLYYSHIPSQIGYLYPSICCSFFAQELYKKIDYIHPSEF